MAWNILRLRNCLNDAIFGYWKFVVASFLQIFDRHKWIQAISNGGYEQLCDKLTWGPTVII